MANDFIVHTAHPRGSRLDHLSVEPLIMVPSFTVQPYINHTDPIIADKRRGIGYGMELERFPRVEEYIHLRWYQDKKFYPCRVVYYNRGKDCPRWYSGSEKNAQLST